ncbi:MAG: alpha/beta hydrolase [Spirochaetales bacterium]|nr:alpha/beta hydrolase [Spirochaetales bacterium]
MMKFIKYLTFILLIITFSCSSKPNFSNESIPEKISVTRTKSGYMINPLCYDMKTGFIFYPGGLVEAEAYIPQMSKIALESNIAVFIVKMPLNLAVFNQNGAKKVLKEFDYINDWYIGGHSLGGVMATSYLQKNPSVFSGLILMASYPTEKMSISNLNIKVLSIKGSDDGLVLNSDIDSSKYLLPKDTIYITIPGGNHAKFGSYGEQKGDNPGTISEFEQHQQVSIAVKQFLK